jgi:hypothetical protein
MHPLRLDYLQRRRFSGRIGWVILLISLGMGAYLVNAYFDLQAEKKAWQAQWMKTGQGQRTANDPLNSEESRKLKPELNRANEVVQHLALKWDDLFKGLEFSTKDVALLNIQPDAQKRLLIITAEAANFNDMLEYTKRLSEQRVFADVHVINHQIQEQDPQKPVRFTVMARWMDSVSPAPGLNVNGR